VKQRQHKAFDFNTLSMLCIVKRIYYDINIVADYYQNIVGVV